MVAETGFSRNFKIIFAKNPKFDHKNRIFDQKSRFLAKNLEIFVKNPKFSRFARKFTCDFLKIPGRWELTNYAKKAPKFFCLDKKTFHMRTYHAGTSSPLSDPVKAKHPAPAKWARSFGGPKAERLRGLPGQSPPEWPRIAQ